MILEEAIIIAKRCEADDVISASGRALIVLVQELERYQKINPETMALIEASISQRSGKLPRHVESLLRIPATIYQD